ncbi:hypothetical protein [Rhizobium sp. L245/93]|uniref:hypothetical protein n=1 Tax=Rhizobium sp. L245/93 TaxID=2819998 RepID=UPI001AD9C792|nr:hypothetical protein [Rhizobium sp. L245/93]MBO9166790.1 hypothetical protein [Rhizobium sp. L245/93]
MIKDEHQKEPSEFKFDVALISVGFEQRCRWVTESKNIVAGRGIGLEFGFLAEGSYTSNRAFFTARGFKIVEGLGPSAVTTIVKEAIDGASDGGNLSVFVDISAMSREMIANIVLALKQMAKKFSVTVTVAYAPSKYSGPYAAAPIRLASPIKPALAGWSAFPELPVGALFGLGCDPGLALGALQFLEPNKAWIFSPKGIDTQFDKALLSANEHIEDIFDVTRFDYDIESPSQARGRIEVLLNAIDREFRVVVVPFGPKIFAWLALATVVFTDRSTVGVWAFSSKEQAQLVDRAADGPIIWHSLTLSNS